MAFVSTFTEFAMMDTRTTSGALVLPLTTDIPGRIINIKDTYGAFTQSSLTIYTQGGETFEDGTNTKILNCAYDQLQVYTGSTTRWYITGGTEQNITTANISIISTLQTYNWPSLCNNPNFGYGSTFNPLALGKISLLDNIFTSTTAGLASTFIEFGNLNAQPVTMAPGGTFRWLTGVEADTTQSRGLAYKLKQWQSFGLTNSAIRYGANFSTLRDVTTWNNDRLITHFGSLVTSNAISASTMQVGSVFPTISSFGPTASNYTFALARGDAYKPVGTGWQNVSDMRLKQNIVDADNNICYNNIKQLPLRRFTYISTFIDDVSVYDKRVLGFISQEVSTIIPKAITFAEGYGINDLQVLNRDQIDFALYGAVKKTMDDKEALESTVYSLQTLNGSLIERVSTLEGKIMSL